jgi:hypothetical protein
MGGCGINAPALSSFDVTIDAVGFQELLDDENHLEYR